MVKLLPGSRDELDEPPALVRTGRQTAVGGGAPDAGGGRAQDLVAQLDREPKVVQRAAEALDEQRATLRVVSKEACAAVAAGQAQHGDLVPGGITGTRHAQLQHRRGAIFARDLGDERFRRVLVRTADNDGPVAFEAGDEAREVLLPGCGTDRTGLVANDRGDRDHDGTLAQRVSALDADRAVVGDSPPRVVGDLPYIAVRVGEGARRSAPLGEGRRSNNRASSAFGLLQNLADLLR